MGSGQSREEGTSATSLPHATKEPKYRRVVRPLCETAYSVVVPLKYDDIPLGTFPGASESPEELEAFVKRSSIELHVRLVCNVDREPAASPPLLYFQGGPGSPSTSRLLQNYPERLASHYTVVLMDQRGTGQSTPFRPTHSSVWGDTVGKQAACAACLRADSIVRDGRRVIDELFGTDVAPYIMGQSFGGFCCLTYLSVFPNGARGALVCGGLPSLHRHPRDVYERTFVTTELLLRRYFTEYPEDGGRWRSLLRLLQFAPLDLPGDGKLTSRRVRQFGIYLGFTGGFRHLHGFLRLVFQPRLLADASPGPSAAQSGGDPPVYGVEEDSGRWAFACPVRDPRRAHALLQNNRPFIDYVAANPGYESRPLYFLHQESIYAQGFATRWAAAQVESELPRFRDGASVVVEDGVDKTMPVTLTGEPVFPWMTEDYAGLRPLRGVAECLAQKEDWPPLYDRTVLGRNATPIVAAVYDEDLYVPRDLSLETAAEVGSVTVFESDLPHDGIARPGTVPALVERLRGIEEGTQPVQARERLVLPPEE